MELGDSAGRMLVVAKKRAARGLRTPMVDDRVRVAPYLLESWNLWDQLHAMRAASGFGASPLSPADIVAHLTMMGSCDPDTYVHVMALEMEWLEWARRKQVNADGKPPDQG